jgi:hypothetical protein
MLDPTAPARANREIVFDKFHTSKHLRSLSAGGGNTNSSRRSAHDRLIGTRYDWLRHPAGPEPGEC